MCSPKSIALIALIFLLSAVGAHSQERGSRLEILSKDDAQIMFAMTKDQWAANVMEALGSGFARAMGDPDSGYAMVMDTADGDLLMVKPIYANNLSKPSAIMVTVGYRFPRASLLSRSALEEIVVITKQQMAPQYQVSAEIEKMPEGIAIYFTIFEEMPEFMKRKGAEPTP